MLYLLWCSYPMWISLLGGFPQAQAAEPAALAYAKGIVAYGNRNYLEALEHFRHVVDLEPNNPDGQLYFGLTFIRLGEFQKASTALDKTPQRAPTERHVEGSVEAW